MDWPALWTSIILVAVGAVISLGTSYVVERGKDRRAEASARRLRDREEQNRRMNEGAEVVRDVFGQINSLWRRHHAWNEAGSVRAKIEADQKTIVQAVYDRYLLIPDPLVRQAVQDAMYAFNNRSDLRQLSRGRENTPRQEATEILMCIRQTLAASLRGDTAHSDDMDYLRSVARDLDERYGAESTGVH